MGETALQAMRNLMTQPENDGNFRSDLARHWGRRHVLAGGVGLAFIGAGVGQMIWGRAAAAQQGTATDGSVCIQPPSETAGPFPGDGTNSRDGSVVNVLTQAGVLRQDLRPSFGGLNGTADGVTLTLDIRLVNVNAACAPVADHALYLWACDAPGRYSLYDLPDQNYQRGLQVSDATGLIRFVTTFPGCYPGRWPHFHFEVFANPDAAVSGDMALLTAQFALPQVECQAVYTDPRYGDSAGNLAELSLESDGIFRNNDPAALAAQTIALTGDGGTGYQGTVTVGLAL
jgi:protocatechuate 3,4-dioxygenase beta subunit